MIRSKNAALALAVTAAIAAGSASAATTQFGDTKVTLGGYVKSDLSYTTNGVNSQGNLLFVRQHANTADDSKDTYMDMTASESRIWIKTDTNGLKTHIEGDFLFEPGKDSNANEYVSNSNYLRLRHAYLSGGNWLAGQTWSTFMDLAHLGELLDFSQHASTIFVRQNQIRYTLPMGNSNLMLALENSATFSTAGPTETGSRPDIIARYNIKGGWGHASAGVLFTEQYDSGTKKSDDGVAYSLTAKLKVGAKDDIRLQYNGGALGRYMGAALFASFDGNEAQDSMGYSAAYRHWWSDKTRSTIMFSHVEADDDGAVFGGDTGVKEAETLHVNFMWDVAPKTRIGFEYQNTDITRKNNAEVDTQRYQFSARRIF